MFQKVLAYTGDYKKTTYQSIVFLLIGVLMNIIPYFFVYQIIKPLLMHEVLSASYIVWRIAAIAVCAILYGVLYVHGLSLSLIRLIIP